MTATFTTAHDPTVTAADVNVLRQAAGRMLATISTVDPDDRRWDTAGRLVSIAATRLREALGTPVVGECAGAPPIVRERDLSTAAHRLLARDVRIQNAHAAQQFLRAAVEVSVAFL